MSDSKNAAAKMSKKSRYRNFEAKAGTVLLHDGGKAGTRLPPKAGTGLPLWEKAGTQPEPDRESCRQLKEYQPGGLGRWKRPVAYYSLIICLQHLYCQGSNRRC